SEQIPLMQERIDTVNRRVEEDTRVVRQLATSASTSTDGRLYSFRPSALLHRIAWVRSLIEAGDVWKPLRFYLEGARETSTMPSEADGSLSTAATPPVTIAIESASRREETVTYGYATLVEVAPCLS